MMKSGLLFTAISVAATVFAFSAQAVTVSQLIHFDDANNGQKDYTTDDGNFFFDPTNFQSSSLCADTTSSTGSANGSCLIEGKQGVLPEMTRLTDDGVFSLDSFYFLLTGNGTGSSNAITASSGGTTTTFQHSGTYTNVFDYLTGSLVTGALVDGVGYIADVSALTHFDDTMSVQFGAATSAQIRLDCIVATFDGSTTEAYDSATSCGLDDGGGGVIIPTVPLPATLPLLLTAIGFGGFTLRKNRKAA